MKFLYFILFITFGLSAAAQQSGCTDPNAINYSSAASINDGSCTYNVTGYMPEIKYVLPNEVIETSGLIFLDGKLYTFNDSQNAPIIYRLDTLNGIIDQRITLLNVQNNDWEDIASDNQYLYIGDFGNNYGNRTNLMIYRIPLSEIPADGDVSLSPEIIHFSFSDQTDFSIRDRNHDFDCESMLIHNNQINLFTKNWLDGQSRWYTLPTSPGTYIAQIQGTFNTDGLVTGADISEDGSQISLVGYKEDVWIPFIWILFDFQQNNLFSGNKRRIDFPLLVASQMEGICYYQDGNIFISSEQTQIANQQLFRLNTENWVSSQSTAIAEIREVPFSLEIIPNPEKDAQVKIIIKNLKEAAFNFKIIDSSGKLVEIKHYKVTTFDNEHHILLNKKNLKEGIYFIHLSTKKHSLVEKLIIL